MNSLDLSSLLRLDITNKEMEQLKQTLKRCQRLDYSNLPISEKINFDKFFVNQLRDIQLEITKKQENHEFIDMRNVFIQVMDIMETQIKYIETINNEQDSFKNSSLRPKRKNNNYCKEKRKTF